ncbi:MAG: hypothetical protein KAG53_02885 [Endozoicomonadaceae bacterium]|nr:hypothetical protein [Endozoicomonadaceae bacterium]
MKITFDNNRIRIRLTRQDFDQLQKETPCHFKLSVDDFCVLSACVRMCKKCTSSPFLCQTKEGVLDISFHPTMIEEIIENPKNGLCFKQGDIDVSIALDLKQKKH